MRVLARIFSSFNYFIFVYFLYLTTKILRRRLSRGSVDLEVYYIQLRSFAPHSPLSALQTHRSLHLCMPIRSLSLSPEPLV